jgi:hypothetical protein
MQSKGWVLAAALCVPLAACVTPQAQMVTTDKVAVEAEARKQKELYVQELLRDRVRLQSVAAPIAAANAPLCGAQVTADLGIGWWNVEDVPKHYREATAGLYNLTNLVQVSYVVPGGPGARAGIAPGDQIVSLNGRDVPTGDGASQQLRGRVRDLAKGGGQAADLVLRRNGLRVQAQVQPAVVCDFPVTIGASDKVNAYADGDRMIVTQGMLRFVQNDQELAVVLGHELAHNAMGHLSAKTANSVMGGAGGFMLDVLVAAAGVNTGGAFTRMGMKAGADAFSTDFEREADYVGLYMIARAGFEIEAAPNFWRRMGMRQPGSIEHASTHPSTADRAVALEGTVAEVRRKQAAGLPLVPDMKPKVETQTKLESGGAK